jgi:O-phosphoseryl-tRNA(Sec) kinase
MCGIPASGKTTHSKELAEQYNAIIFSYDELKKNTKHFSELKQVRNKMMQDIVITLKDSNVVLDDLNVSKSMRLSVLDRLSSISTKKVCVVMTTSLEECLLRDATRPNKLPEYIIRDMFKRYEAPTENEGWDEIVYV